MELPQVQSNDRMQRQQPPGSPPSPSHNHKRAFHRKVKTGCLTCRRRHVKCDEAKPQCDMCTKKGYVCSGYPRLTPTRLSSVLQVPDIRGRNEYQAFHFFMEVAQTWFEKKTRACISECHVDEFWDPVLIQITESEPAIKHILLAWAELHRRILYEHVTPEEPFENDFFWQNHCQALRILGSKKQIDVSVMLVACIMLCILEKFRGHTDNFLQHLQSGIRILHDYDQKSADSKQSMCDNMIARCIRPLLMAFQLNLEKILENDSLYPDGVSPTRRVKLDQADRTVKSWN